MLGSRELLALRGLVADDPFRAVQVLPGVATGDDFRAEFAVRGLGPSNIGISIDGVDSPLLFHTVRGVQDTGSLGLINSDILESATLLAGPASAAPEFAPRLAARFHHARRFARAAHGARHGERIGGQHGLGRAARIGKNASWLVAVRKSYIDWLLRQIDSTTDTTFGFTRRRRRSSPSISRRRQSLRVSMIAGQIGAA